MTLRLFAAVYPPADVAGRVHVACAPLHDAAPPLRWEPPGRLHCTVRFYGAVEADGVAMIAAGLAEAARLFDPLPVEVRGLGAFPAWGRARVVWAGVRADPKFELLHHEIEVRAMALGFEVEGRVFRPHLTLARVPADVELPVRRAIREAARGVRVRERFTVDEVVLMSSTAGPTGTRHEAVARAPLGRH
ncbi:MAG: RNA 2',3'-cyclic phosphodiesterase [Gemmatimonadota bacterium]